MSSEFAEFNEKLNGMEFKNAQISFKSRNLMLIIEYENIK
jgi:hypothetical protein